MPNWCHNKIQFKGGEHLDEIKKILNKNPNGILDFEDFGYTGDQRIDEDYNIVKIDKNEINIFCLTAWSPPVSFLEDMSLMFPGTDITMQYCEASIEFAGEVTFEPTEQYVLGWNNRPLGNWHCDFFNNLEDEERYAMLEEMWDEDPETEEMKELMDKVYNKDLSDFMFNHFGGPVGG